MITGLQQCQQARSHGEGGLSTTRQGAYHPPGHRLDWPEGIWRRRVESQETLAEKRRVWRKLHLAVNPATHDIAVAEVSLENVHDAEVLPTLLNPLRCKLGRVYADGDISLTNNEAERSLRGYVLWRKGSYGVCSHRGELFRQRILSLVETAKRLGCCTEEWLRAVVRACIEKTDCPIPVELCASSPCQ